MSAIRTKPLVTRRRRELRTIARAVVVVLGATLALGAPALSAESQGSGSVSTGSPVVITVKGRGVHGDTTGTFTLRGAASDSGASWMVFNNTEGGLELNGKKGHLSFSLSASSTVSVNAFTTVGTGTWRIRRGAGVTKTTGMYRAWKGSGKYVSVDRHAPSPNSWTPSGIGSSEARFSGVVTR